jgi:hypothetical protein
VESRKGRGLRIDLGDDLEQKLAAFAATYHVKNKTDIIREALIEHMEKRWTTTENVAAAIIETSRRVTGGDGLDGRHTLSKPARAATTAISRAMSWTESDPSE